jgi:methanogenic corrinoid protein MtbC1
VAFLRVKRAGGRVYAYLVESHWDSAARHPRQRVIAYLGRLDRARAESVPAKYRTPPLLRALDARVSAERARLRSGTVDQCARFVERLLAGDRAGARIVARRTIHAMGAETFYSEILVPALHEIGRRYAARQISISTEHLATGIASAVLAEVNAAMKEAPPGSPEVVLCLPEGEDHTLALQVAEGLLRRMGYRTLNVAGSAPADSVAEFVRARHPAAVLISVTMPDRLEPGRRLSRRLLRETPGLRVAIGGQGTSALPAGAHPDGVDLVRGTVEEYLDGWPAAADGTGTGLGGEPATRR